MKNGETRTQAGQSIIERAHAEVFCDEHGTCWMLADGRTPLDALTEVAKLEDVTECEVQIVRVTGSIRETTEGLWFFEDSDGEDGIEAWKVMLG